MFTDIDADIYVLVDGDATYDAPSARAMIDKLVAERLDMVCAVRVDREEAAYRLGHRAGNRLLTGFVAHVFGQSFTDMLSGYRVFTRRFVKSFPALSGGFEIETELTVHALELELPVGEMPTPYYSRPQGSASKLSTWRDGYRILRTVLRLYRAERPLPLFTGIGISLAIVAIGIAIPIFVTYLQEGTGAAAADRGAVDRPDAAGLPVGRLRPDPRHGDARAARDSSCWPIWRSARRPKSGGGADDAVHELVRTNNAVLITAIEALLKGADIPHMVLDQHMSVLEGSLGMLPRRIVVDGEHWEVARQLLEDAGPGARAAAAIERAEAGDDRRCGARRPAAAEAEEARPPRRPRRHPAGGRDRRAARRPGGRVRRGRRRRRPGAGGALSRRWT